MPYPRDVMVDLASLGEGRDVDSVRGGMTRRDFFDEVALQLRPQLPEERRGFSHRPNSFLMKIDYGNPRVHFEVWCDGERRILGIGLHFEDGPASTAEYLAFFDRYIVEIKHVLGTEIELERWTASWAHIYEHRPLERLTETLAGEVAARLAEMIGVLQPLVEVAGVAPEGSRGVSAGEERRGAWRRARR